VYLFTGKDVGRHFHDYTHAVCHSKRMRKVVIRHRTVALSHRQREASEGVHINSGKKEIRNDELVRTWRYHTGGVHVFEKDENWGCPREQDLRFRASRLSWDLRNRDWSKNSSREISLGMRLIWGSTPQILSLSSLASYWTNFILTGQKTTKILNYYSYCYI